MAWVRTRSAARSACRAWSAAFRSTRSARPASASRSRPKRRRSSADRSSQGARVAVQGFGAVGQHAARFLAEKGAVLVAASDTHGAVADPKGLDVAALIALKRGRQVRSTTHTRRQDARPRRDRRRRLRHLDSGSAAGRAARRQRRAARHEARAAGRQYSRDRRGRAAAARARHPVDPGLHRQCRRRHLRGGRVSRRHREGRFRRHRRKDRGQHARSAGWRRGRSGSCRAKRPTGWPRIGSAPRWNCADGAEGETCEDRR